jgi:hypothetical protein
MIAIIYAPENLDIRGAMQNIPKHIDVIYCYRPADVHEILARESRNIIERLMIKEGMRDTSAMIGDCTENSPRIPVDIIKSSSDIKRLYKRH